MRAAASTGSSDNHFPLQLRFVSERFFAWTFAGTPSETAEAYPDDMIDDCWIAECWGGGGRGGSKFTVYCLPLARMVRKLGKISHVMMQASRH